MGQQALALRSRQIVLGEGGQNVCRRMLPWGGGCQLLQHDFWQLGHG
jgi:hypothetical protein